MKLRKGWRMSCDVGEVTERLENEQSFPKLPKYYARLQKAVARGLGWPACRQAGPHTDAAPKHHCYFSSISLANLIWCFFCKNMTSTVEFSTLYGACFFESFSLSPNCTGIRHRSSRKLYSKFASCFRTRFSAFHIRIVNITRPHNDNSCLGMSQIAIITIGTLQH